MIEQGLAVAATAIGRVDSQKTDVEIVMFQLAAEESEQVAQQEAQGKQARHLPGGISQIQP